MVDRALQTGIRAFTSVATYTPVTGSPYSVNGVFNRCSQSVDPDTGAPVETAHPTFSLRLADLVVPPASGDNLVLNGTTYRVVKSDEDGEGGTLLTLHKQG